MLKAAAAIAVVAVVAEVALRAGLFGAAGLVPDVVVKEDFQDAHWHQAGQAFTWRGQLGNPREFSVPSKWNAQGRNDGDYAVAKAPGTLRIVVLGDLFVEAVQVPQERSFHNLLETRLNAAAPPGRHYEVIALGLSGSGPRRSLDVLRQQALALKPDIVVEEFYALNDVSDDSDDLAVAFAMQRKRLKEISSRVYLPERWTGESAWAARLHLADSRVAVLLGQSWNDFVYRRRLAQLPPVDRIPHQWFALQKDYDPADPYEKAWIEGWKNEPGYIRDAARECAQAGARFLLVRFPDRWRTEPDGRRELESAYPALRDAKLDLDRDARMLEALARDDGMAYLDLFPDFRANWTGSRPLHYRVDSHWNERGHDVAAAAIERTLRARNWVQ